MRVINLFLIVCLTTGCVSAEKNSQKTHPFSVHDMMAMDRISDPQVSPDGKKIVFTLRKTDLKENKVRTDLWLTGVDGKGLRQLTSHPEGDFNPRWSTDGKSIWFLSGRSESSQVYKIPVDGGEAQQVTSLPLDVSNLVVSADGKHIAFTMQVFPDGSSPEATKKKLDAIEESKSTGVIYDKVFIRHWDTWKDGRRSHLFVLPVSGGEAVDVMSGMDADAPTIPWGGTEEIAFSPDGKEIVFSARDVGREEPWSTDVDLYRVPINGSTAPKCITEKNKAWDTGPLFSPDGKILAYLAMTKPGYESDRLRIVLHDWASGKKRVLTEKWDRSPSSICWSADGKTIYATATNVGQKSLFAIDTAKGRVRVVVKDGSVSSPSIAGKRIVYGMDNLKSPVELYSVKADGRDIRAITQINKVKVAAARMGSYEQFVFKGWKNEKVYCYVVKPADFAPGRTYPVAFLIHGGPQGSFGNHFHYRWNPQVYAGAGYVSVMIDFHGSTGYGQDFTDSIGGDWGGKPLVDLQKGLAAFLKRYRWADANRVGALGASFGGYMINWIEGNWQGAFKCMVNHDGNLDERMAYYDTEELWFPEWDHRGTPWDNPKGYEKHNPVNFVKNWKTPMLVIHGALDYRVVDTQGIATFNALQRLGIESKFLYFPDENHWVLKPHNSILWHDTVIGWLDHYLKK
ncbi:MAG: S9 family peptidase [Planctomycetes bacterium]|nr:S9 family peptidase [Planctomycetota bacterium]